MIKKGDKIVCSIWSGPTYGIYIGVPNRDRYFSKEFENDVIFEIDNKECRAKFAPSFWETCPEIRVAKDDSGKNYLSYWIKKNQLLPPTLSRKQKGKEDKVVLEVIEPYKRFKLYCLNFLKK